MSRICLIGLGEVGAVLAEDIGKQGRVLVAWDIQFADVASKPSVMARLREIRAAASASEAVRGASIVFSAVTAAQTGAAARAAAPAIDKDALYIDLNSASPGAKLEAAACISDAGGRYVEASVMSPIAPKRIAAPILLGGPHAQAAELALTDMGFASARAFSDQYGKAAAAKLCRSVMVKGIEALLCESLVSARRYGVEASVLASLSDLFPGIDWPSHARYMISRAIEHGVRRAEEMREASRTVAEAGLAPLMSDATAIRQDWAATFSSALAHEELASMLDAISAQEKSHHDH